LEIIAGMEAHLRDIGEWTDLRANAVAAARLEIARSLWKSDREAARRLAGLARQTAPRAFHPTGAAFPPLYRKVYGWLGFEMAERVAGLKRVVARAR
jgi:hypothetical protein